MCTVEDQGTLAPSVMMTLHTPIDAILRAASSAVRSSVMRIPEMASASVSFGVIAYSVSSSPAERLRGRGRVQDDLLAQPVRHHGGGLDSVCIGISSCNRMISAASTASADRFRSLGVRCALAPGATTMQFSASVSTVIRATPDGFRVGKYIRGVDPSSLNSWLAWCPKMSLPVLQMKRPFRPDAPR